jgi:hypothetical protein
MQTARCRESRARTERSQMHAWAMGDPYWAVQGACHAISRGDRAVPIPMLGEAPVFSAVQASTLAGLWRLERRHGVRVRHDARRVITHARFHGRMSGICFIRRNLASADWPSDGAPCTSSRALVAVRRGWVPPLFELSVLSIC